jgi:hypothetical protein
MISYRGLKLFGIQKMKVIFKLSIFCFKNRSMVMDDHGDPIVKNKQEFHSY